MKHTMRTRIIAEIHADPTLHDHVIADKLDVSRCYVSQIRKRENLPRIPCQFLAEENRRFIADEAKASGVDMPAIINAIVTDARMDAQEAST